jgi:mono/diheme cytochrome c family protein
MKSFKLTPRLTIPSASIRAIALLACGVMWSSPLICLAQTADDGEFAELKSDTEKVFEDRVAPFIKTYCIDCHQNKRPTRAGVNFSPALKAPGHAAFSEQWKKAVARVMAHDMPPAHREAQPTAEERQMFSDWQAKIKFLSPKDPGPFVIRRLTKTEYGNTLHDLFGVDPAIADELPEDVSGEGYLNSLSPLQLEQYLAITDEVLNQILAREGAPPTEIEERLIGETPALDADARAAARDVAQSLARRAYRRPPSEAELEVLLAVFDLGRENDLDYRAAARLMFKAMLVSPQFLFITPAQEISPDVEIAPLDDYQLASRLSYLLWATMPDDELMELADAGRLHEQPILRTQVTRLLMDPRSRALFDGFGAQWLALGNLQETIFDPAKFPQMTGEMRTAMYDELRLLFESIVRENRNVVGFIDSDYTFLNENLATIYGLQETITGPEMRRVQLSDGNRGGILGMPGVLAATSFPNRTSPVKRGVWVLEQVLGDQVPSAPPNVPALEGQDQDAVATLTLRERTELHRTNAVCANCHKILDPIGFGLENFDAIGRWRDQDDNGEAIDASGELPGGKHFSSPKELKAIVAERVDDFSRNFVERLLAYALCRRLEGYDEIVVDGLVRDVARDGYRMQTIISAVVTSYPFTHRRIQEERTPNEQEPSN